MKAAQTSFALGLAALAFATAASAQDVVSRSGNLTFWSDGAGNGCASRSKNGVVSRCAGGDVACPAGYKVVSGAVNCDLVGISSHPTGNGWHGDCAMRSTADLSNRITVKCMADALTGPDDYKVVKGTITPDTSGPKNCDADPNSPRADGKATCPDGFVAVGGGGSCLLPSSTGGLLLQTHLEQPKSWILACCTSSSAVAGDGVTAVCVRAGKLVSPK